MNQAERIVAATPYTHGYYRELSPAALVLALELRGLRPPSLEQPLNYCELGMGFGVSLVANAACFPRMRFFGNDFNAAHVAYARRLAADAALSNVEVFEDDFQGLPARALPPMDFIVLHGVWSWVGAQARQAILEFVERRLAPGGVVYVSYNALPAWGPIAPLREAMALHNARAVPASASAAERARAVLAFARQLQVQGAPAMNTPQAVRRLEQLAEADPAYLFHEYLVPEWHPFHFHQVAAEFGRAGLSFAASADAHENLAAAPAPGEDAVLHETRRDFITHRWFRSDLFSRDAEALSGEAQARTAGARRWRLVDCAPLERLAQLPAGPRGRLEAMPVQPLLAALETGSLSLAEAQALPALRHAPAAALLEAFTHLAGPEMSQALAEAARGSVRRFNEVALARAGRDGLTVLLSPHTGIAMHWSAQSLHLIDLHRTGLADPNALAAAWQERLLAAGLTVRRDGVELHEDEALRAFLAERARHYMARQAPRLAGLEMP